MAGPGAAAATPRGGKATLLGISKRGDAYLRTLLIHGARVGDAHKRRAKLEADQLAAQTLMARRNKNIAAVALANKNARIAWALLAHEREFRAGLHAGSRGRVISRLNGTTAIANGDSPPIAQAIMK